MSPCFSPKPVGDSSKNRGELPTAGARWGYKTTRIVTKNDLKEMCTLPPDLSTHVRAIVANKKSRTFSPRRENTNFWNKKRREK